VWAADGSYSLTSRDPNNAAVSASLLVADSNGASVMSVSQKANGTESVILVGSNAIYERGAGSEKVTFGTDSFLFSPLSTATVSAGGTNDTIALHQGFGTVTISAFDSTAKAGATHDTIQLDNTLFAGWNDLLSHAAQQGTATVITDTHGDKLTLTNTALASLSSNDFKFV